MIRRRFMSVAIISVIIPLLLSCFGAESGKEEVNRTKMGNYPFIYLYKKIYVDNF